MTETPDPSGYGDQGVGRDADPASSAIKERSDAFIRGAWTDPDAFSAYLDTLADKPESMAVLAARMGTTPEGLRTLQTELDHIQDAAGDGNLTPAEQRQAQLDAYRDTIPPSVRFGNGVADSAAALVDGVIHLPKTAADTVRFLAYTTALADRMASSDPATRDAANEEATQLRAQIRSAGSAAGTAAWEWASRLAQGDAEAVGNAVVGVGSVVVPAGAGRVASLAGRGAEGVAATAEAAEAAAAAARVAEETAAATRVAEAEAATARAAREAEATAQKLVGGDGIGPWGTEVTNIEKGATFTQCASGSCVSATGQILTNGTISEATLLARLGEWSTPDQLAKALNELDLSGNIWRGGYFANTSDAVTLASRGPIGAVLQAPNSAAHMVTISPTGIAGSFIVQDTGAGATYSVTAAWIEKYVAGGVWKK
jgi:hypothetical protein